MTRSWKYYAKLDHKKFREESGLYLVEGIRLCREAFLAGQQIEAMFTSESFFHSPSYHEFQEYIKSHHIKPHTLSDTNFKKLAKTETPQGILLVLKIPDPQQDLNDLVQKQKIILILDRIRDPGNMGTLLRTAEWFGINTIFSSPDSVDFYNPKTVRASMGAIFRMNLFEVDNLPQIIKDLKERKFFIISAMVHEGMLIEKTHPRPPVGIILGGETHGVSPQLQNLSDAKVRIFRFGETESLNVSIAGGILMHYFSNQFFKKRLRK